MVWLIFLSGRGGAEQPSPPPGSRYKDALMATRPRLAGVAIQAHGRREGKRTVKDKVRPAAAGAALPLAPLMPRPAGR